MSEIDSSHIGKIVSFTVYPAAILGSAFNHVKVLGILDAASAFQFVDPASLHANVYPTLPGGTPNDYKAYTYVKIQFQNGEVTCVGMPWIETGSLTVHEGTTMRVTIYNTSASELQRLREALISNGFNTFEVEVVD